MIIWSERASRQLKALYDYILEDKGKEVAEQVASTVLKSIQHLDTFPLAGRSGRIEGTRELVVPNTPFIAAYMIEGHRVLVLAIYHGAQRWPTSF